MDKLWAIPDIHGRADLLTRLLSTLVEDGHIDNADKLIFLGDMIDRGADSKGVVKLIQGLHMTKPDRVVVLAGNHEDMCVDAQEDAKKVPLWLMNGGVQTLESYGGAMDPFDVEWMKTLPYLHEEPGFFFSHAPAPRENRRSLLNKGQPFTREELTWGCSRDEPGYARAMEDTIGVCGHKHDLQNWNLEPRFYEHYIYADAGCGCHPKAPLVAVECRTRQVVFAHPHDLAS